MRRAPLLRVRSLLLIPPPSPRCSIYICTHAQQCAATTTTRARIPAAREPAPTWAAPRPRRPARDSRHTGAGSARTTRARRRSHYAPHPSTPQRQPINRDETRRWVRVAETAHLCPDGGGGKGCRPTNTGDSDREDTSLRSAAAVVATAVVGVAASPASARASGSSKNRSPCADTARSAPTTLLEHKKLPIARKAP